MRRDERGMVAGYVTEQLAVKPHALSRVPGHVKNGRAVVWAIGFTQLQALGHNRANFDHYPILADPQTAVAFAQLLNFIDSRRTAARSAP